MRHLILEGRVAIVTGSSAGIGFAIAQTLAKAGASVVINGRTLDKLDEAEDSIEANGGKILAIQADASETEGIEKIVTETKNYFGHIDILVNNAATVGVGQSVEEMPIEVWDDVMSTNLRAVFLMCKAVIPHLKERDGGRIINIGGLSGKNPLAFAAADACAKAGLMALTRVLAAELGYFQTTVNTVIPGFQPDTEIGQQFNEKLAGAFMISPEESIAVTRAKTLLKRFETLDELAGTVLFLCSDASEFVTGTNFVLDDGQTL